MTAAEEPARHATAGDATGRDATAWDATAGDEAVRDAALDVGTGAVPARATGVQGMVERQIRQAQDRGAFDNLPGAGLPLRDLGSPHDENWWLRQHLLREGVSGAAFLPPTLALRKEIEDLPERVRELPTEVQVRLAVHRLNDRILDALRKPGDGPPVTVMAVEVEEVVLRWRFARIAARRPAIAAEPADEPAPARLPADPTNRTRLRRRWRRS